MKLFTVVVLQFVIIFKLNLVASANNRKWLEIGKELYRVEPEGKYTWEQAVAECKKEHSKLISPKGDYNYAKLKDVIGKNFENYSSFWTNNQIKWSSVLQQIGLARRNGQKCFKFDNSTNFKYSPDNCEKRYGFICEKSLLKGYSLFKTENTIYLVQSDEKFTCEMAYDICEKHQMSLVVIRDYLKNNRLKNYIFTNYGSSLNFWFSFNNKTHNNCITVQRNPRIKYDLKLGFICQRIFFNSQ